MDNEIEVIIVVARGGELIAHSTRSIDLQTQRTQLVNDAC